jgi:hypothetical protein
VLEIFKTCIHFGGKFDGYQTLILDTHILCLESLLQGGTYNHNALNVEPCLGFFIDLNFHVKPKVAITHKRMKLNLATRKIEE